MDLLLIIVFDNKKVDGKKITTALQTTASVVCSPSFAIIYASASEYANAIPTYETRGKGIAFNVISDELETIVQER